MRNGKNTFKSALVQLYRKHFRTNSLSANYALPRIHYSDRYSDDKYEYRHVILPKPLLKLLPKQYYSDDDSGTLRLLSEPEWRGIGITQSLGWVHYEVHGETLSSVVFAI